MEAEIKQLVEKYRTVEPCTDRYTLTKNYLGVEEISAAIQVLLSGQITMSTNVDLFEKEFANYIGTNYAVMVNSGSSANLLAVSLITNTYSSYAIPSYSEILVPAICWSTSVWPLVQCNLKPVFVDCDPNTLNIDILDIENKITPKTRGILLVHVLGNCTNMTKLMEIIEKHNLILIEDTCEALGSTYKKKSLGTFGTVGTFSFYYSHHITTGEGGMIVCDKYEDYMLLKVLRSHGWSRDIKQKNEGARIGALDTDVDANVKGLHKQWIFINQGYNLRSTEINAAIGRIQLKRLGSMIKIRCYNRKKVKDRLYAHDKYHSQITIFENSKDTFTSWFGLCCKINEKYKNQYSDYIHYLQEVGIDNRPIISGNFLRQPAIKLIKDMYEMDELDKMDPASYTGAEIINNQCFYIGLHPIEMTDKECNILVNRLLSFPFSEM